MRTPTGRLLRRIATVGSTGEQSAAAARSVSKVTRRQAIAVGGVGCALASLGKTQVLAAPTHAESIAIVGAGLAGLHCAYRLQQIGLRVKVYEAAARLGGRCLTDRSIFAGVTCELGGEFIDTDHVVMRSLVEEFGLEMVDMAADDGALHEAMGYFGGERFTAADLLEEYRGVLSPKIDAAWATLRDPEGAITCRTPNGAEALDRISIAEWLEGAELSRRMRSFLTIAYQGEYGLPIEEQSALNLLSLLAGVKVKPDAKEWNTYGSSDERFRIAGGNDRVVQELAKRVGGDAIEMERRLTGLSQLSDGRVRLSFGKYETAADRVVLALPFSTLRHVEMSNLPLNDLKRKVIQELGMGQNGKLMCGFREPIWRTRYQAAGTVYSDLDCQTIWDSSRMQKSGPRVLTNYSAAQLATEAGDLTLVDHHRNVIANLDAIFPGAAALATVDVVRQDWTRYEFTRGSFASYRTGQWTSLGGVAAEPEGNVHFCGEHTSHDWLGFMEDGVESGARAAAEIAVATGAATDAWNGPIMDDAMRTALEGQAIK